MRLSAGKVLVTVFLDYRGIVYIDFLLNQSTINGAYYLKLLNNVKATYQSKKYDVPIFSVLLLFNNAAPHTTTKTHKKLQTIHWATIEPSL